MKMTKKKFWSICWYTLLGTWSSTFIIGCFTPEHSFYEKAAVYIFAFLTYIILGFGLFRGFVRFVDWWVTLPEE